MSCRIMKALHVVALSAAFVSLSGCDEINERLRGTKVALADVPPAVKATLDQESKGRSPEKVVRLTRDGKPVYLATIVADGKEQKTLIGEDGKVLKREDDDDDD